MSKDRYPSMFSPKMEAIVFIMLRIFFAPPVVFKIGIVPNFSWAIFRSRDVLRQIARERKYLKDYKCCQCLSTDEHYRVTLVANYKSLHYSACFSSRLNVQ